VKTHTLQTIKVQTVTLMVKVNGIWHVLCINYVKLIVKYLFLCRHLLWGLSSIQVIYFPFADVFHLRGHLADKYGTLLFTCTTDAGYFQQKLSVTFLPGPHLAKYYKQTLSVQLHTFHKHAETICSPCVTQDD
jgi:hypothetical protein